MLFRSSYVLCIRFTLKNEMLVYLNLQMREVGSVSGGGSVIHHLAAECFGCCQYRSLCSVRQQQSPS